MTASNGEAAFETWIARRRVSFKQGWNDQKRHSPLDFRSPGPVDENYMAEELDAYRAGYGAALDDQIAIEEAKEWAS